MIYQISIQFSKEQDHLFTIDCNPTKYSHDAIIACIHTCISVLNDYGNHKFDNDIIENLKDRLSEMKST